MSARHYGLSPGLVASISLVLAGALAGALTGCGSSNPVATLDPATGNAPKTPVVQKTAANADNSDSTIWTVLGIAKKESELNVGPQTGATVSPVLWEATHDTLSFTGIASEDAMSGLLITDWYTPRGKPNDRLRVSVYILSRALRSDSISVTVERQVRGATGQWEDAPVDREVGTNLETAILQRARQIHSERYRGNL